MYGGRIVGNPQHERLESEFLSQEDLEGMFCHGQQLLHLHVVLDDVDLLVLRVEVLLRPFFERLVIHWRISGCTQDCGVLQLFKALLDSTKIFQKCSATK